jgi:hypothetical protein
VSEVIPDTPADEPTPPPTPEAEPAAKQSTVYLVLSKDADKDWWIVVSTYTAASSKAAIAAAVKDKDAKAGTFVAVPARSWQPLTLKVETATKVTLAAPPAAA